ncbi:MAG: hypothetical protein WD960_12245 [Gemmatimonadota bacterium]
MRKTLAPMLAAISFLLATSPGAAQVAWDSPLMVAPNTPAGWGVYLVDPYPGSGIGVLSTWRASTAPGGLGFRVGLAEDHRDRLAVYGGLDYSGMLLRRSADFPMDVAWVTGVGIGVGDDAVLSAPLGVSMGTDFEADGVWFNPYASPRVVLDAHFGGDGDLDLGLVVDLGIDLAFDPGWAVRFAGSVGDRSALAVGMSFRIR